MNNGYKQIKASSYRADSKFAPRKWEMLLQPSQWEMLLQSYMVSTGFQKKIQALFKDFFKDIFAVFKDIFSLVPGVIAVKKYRVTWQNLKFPCNLP